RSPTLQTAAWEVSSMARLLRLTLAAVLCSAFFVVGCEDDPHDLDYLDAGHGDHDHDEEDAGK
ncbi:MAG TPA: hypothetical protein VJR89_20235, partial [Polyangiales bacterium]|nr:hypothetical protein [Polyangiales bacterium]